MTAIADATLILETLIGRNLTAEQLGRIGDHFVMQAPYTFGGQWFDLTDPENPVPRVPTNEEKAQLVLDTFKYFGRLQVGESATRTKRTEIEADINAQLAAAKSAALADIT